MPPSRTSQKLLEGPLSREEIWRPRLLLHIGVGCSLWWEDHGGQLFAPANPPAMNQSTATTSQQHPSLCTALSTSRTLRPVWPESRALGSEGSSVDRYAEKRQDLQEVQEGRGAPWVPEDHVVPARGKWKAGSEPGRKPLPQGYPHPTRSS